MTEDLVTVATYPNPLNAEFARIELEAAGLACFLADHASASLAPGIPAMGAAIWGTRLQVRRADSAAAEEVLSVMREKLAAEEPAPQSAESRSRTAAVRIGRNFIITLLLLNLAGLIIIILTCIISFLDLFK